MRSSYLYTGFFPEEKLPVSTKSGPVFLIPCDRCQDLARVIDEYEGTKDDFELVQFADYLRTFTKGVSQICVAEEDFVLWPGGPDIRDYQLVGPTAKTTLIREDGVYTNDPADLPSRQINDLNRVDSPCPRCSLQQRIRNVRAVGGVELVMYDCPDCGLSQEAKED